MALGEQVIDALLGGDDAAALCPRQRVSTAGFSPPEAFELAGGPIGELNLKI